ncbi:MAG: hypothetical protein PHN51_10905 [Candidatus Nanopelagicales bacterium]|nr:hypothetical protein [Candidatus Nanopelagicales bacterium]
MDRKSMAGILVSSLAAAMIPLGALAAPAAHADTYVDGRDFGLHVPRVANGVVPTVTYGAIRLWDSGVAWGQVEQQRGKYWWVGLDHAVQAAQAQRAQILYVLGSHPHGVLLASRRAPTRIREPPPIRGLCPIGVGG